MNKDKTKAYILPSLHLNGRVNASGATLRNQADVLINGVKTSTNVVTNASTNSNPSKSVSVSGQDANGKTTITNDMQNFDVTFDLTDYANTTASDAIKSRGIKFTDEEVNSTHKAGFFLDFELGKITEKDFRNEIRKRSVSPLKDNEIDLIWNRMLDSIPEKKLNFLFKIKNQYKLYLLSNTNSIHWNTFSNIKTIIY